MVKYGRWEIIDNYTKSPSGEIRVLCRCECGTVKPVCLRTLKRGLSKSCGCRRLEGIVTPNFKHGKTKTPLHRVWESMKDRCFNSNMKSYKYYGGRGITMCESWKEDFLDFSLYMLTLGWKKGLEIDRINNDGNYEHGNVRVVTHRENSYNRGSDRNSSSKYKGVSITVNNKWSSEITKDGVRYRLGYYKSEEEAAIMYNKKAKELFGEFAYINKITEG